MPTSTIFILSADSILAAELGTMNICGLAELVYQQAETLLGATYLSLSPSQAKVIPHTVDLEQISTIGSYGVFLADESKLYTLAEYYQQPRQQRDQYRLVTEIDYYYFR
jgi:hypothetical protein